jgi:hypothetical protein
MVGQTSIDMGLDALKAGQSDNAVGYLERACLEFPNDYRGFNYLGVAYAQQKQYDRAVGAFQTAMSIRPSVPNIHYNLGLAYQADGLADLARDQIRITRGHRKRFIASAWRTMPWSHWRPSRARGTRISRRSASAPSAISRSARTARWSWRTRSSARTARGSRGRR